MRKIIFLLIIFLSVPGVVWAADPIIGTWKLKSSNDQNLKEAINIYSEVEGGMIELSGTDIFKDGSSYSSKWLWPKEGGIAKCISRKIEEKLLYVEIFVKPGQWYVSIMKNKRQISMYNKIISKDGKTMTQTLTGIDKDGKSLDVLRVFEKQ